MPSTFDLRLSTRRVPRRRGSVILLVLFTILFAVYALTKFVERASVDLLTESRASVGDRLRVEAYSALEATLGVLEDFRTVNGALRSPAEGWSDPLAFAGYQPAKGLEVAVTFEDESGRLSLPGADFQTLTQLFVQLGQRQADAERLADALLGWMRPDYEPVGASSPRADDYEREAIPHSPPARPLRSLAELASIREVREAFYDEAGQPNNLWRSFAAAVSLLSFDQLNVNGGNAAALGAIGGYDETALGNLRDYLTGNGAYTHQGPGFFRTTQEIGPVLGQAAIPPRFGLQISALRINVTVREGQTQFRLSAVVAPPGGARLPPAGNTAAAAQNDQSQTAASGGTNPGTAPPAVPSAGRSETGTSSTAAGQTQSRLNYPFTLLEIRENDEIPDLNSTASQTDA